MENETAGKVILEDIEKKAKPGLGKDTNNMRVSFSEVFPILATAIPGFKPSELDWAEPLPYVFMHQMMHFVCQGAESSHDGCERFAALLEKLAIDGDDEIRYLVMDVVEDMRECESKELIAQHFGPIIRDLWDKVSQSSYSPDDGSSGWPPS